MPARAHRHIGAAETIHVVDGEIDLAAVLESARRHGWEFTAPTQPWQSRAGPGAR